MHLLIQRHTDTLSIPQRNVSFFGNQLTKTFKKKFDTNIETKQMGKEEEKKEDSKGKVVTVIIGGGYAGISLAEHLRQTYFKEANDMSIVLFSYEKFCSRPNLFFRFKFLEWPDKKINYGLLEDATDHYDVNDVNDVKDVKDDSNDIKDGGNDIKDSSNNSGGNDDDDDVNKKKEGDNQSNQKHKNNFYQKYDIQVRFGEWIEHVDFLQQLVISSSGNSQKYDYLVFATGGVPHFINYPISLSSSSSSSEEEEDDDDDNDDDDNDTSSLHHVSLSKVGSPIVKRLLKNQNLSNSIPQNLLLIRNVDEIQALYELIKSCYQNNVLHGAEKERSESETDIVIIGSGALCIDIVTHLLDGYQTIVMKDEKVPKGKNDERLLNEKSSQSDGWKIDNIQCLPKITIITRREDGYIAHSLLKDLDASLIIKNRLQKVEAYSKFLRVISGDQVKNLLCSCDDDLTICGIETHKGLNIKCHLVIQAVGVHSNTLLAEKVGIKIGPKGGILINNRFECISSDGSEAAWKPHTVYAVGDCAEMQIPMDLQTVNGGSSIKNHTDQNTILWKNWTSAREQAVECAKSILSHSYLSTNLWFNQTLRMFGLYVACLGSYEVSADNDDSGPFLVLKKSNISSHEYIKYVFQRVDNEKYAKIVGSLIIGPDMKHYLMGQQILDLMRLGKAIPLDIANEMIKETFQIATLLKKMKSQTSSDIDTLCKEFLTLQLKGDLSATSSVKKIPQKGGKKFVNPLAKKKKKQ